MDSDLLTACAKRRGPSLRVVDVSVVKAAPRSAISGDSYRARAERGRAVGGGKGEAQLECLVGERVVKVEGEEGVVLSWPLSAGLWR